MAWKLLGPKKRRGACLAGRCQARSHDTAGGPFRQGTKARAVTPRDHAAQGEDDAIAHL